MVKDRALARDFGPAGPFACLGLPWDPWVFLTVRKDSTMHRPGLHVAVPRHEHVPCWHRSHRNWKAWPFFLFT